LGDGSAAMAALSAYGRYENVFNGHYDNFPVMATWALAIA
jgi:hypothetical protein